MDTLPGITGCDMVPLAVDGGAPDLTGQDVRVTFLHTSDIHSRLLPYRFDPSFTDNALGLADGATNYGGIARMAYVLKRERANAGRVLHLDSGDCFQGAIIFNEFMGEAEVATLSEAGLDAAVIGNHEFDNGDLDGPYDGTPREILPYLVGQGHTETHALGRGRGGAARVGRWHHGRDGW